MRIIQNTTCRYSRSVRLARIEYRMFPVSSDEQRVIGLRVSIDPACPCTEQIDAWGNVYRKAEWAEDIGSWKLALDMHVETLRHNPFDFQMSDARITAPVSKEFWPAEVQGYLRWEYDPWDNDPAVEAWAKVESVSEEGSFFKIQKLMHVIYREFQFCEGHTDVKTPPGEILRLKVGVCQDFATLLVAAARSLGLPARYVSGYIYEGPKAKRRGFAPVGHGWAEIYFPKLGWRGFDPLNGILSCHTHVRTAQGRWYIDAAPTTGRFIGIGVEQTTETQIDVDLVDAEGKSIE